MGYINTLSKTFNTFVASRIPFIRDNTNAKQWFYILTKSKPADDSLRDKKNVKSRRIKRWLKGPEFLWKTNHELPRQSTIEVDESDPEFRIIVATNFVIIGNDILKQWETRILSQLNIEKGCCMD